MQPWKRLTELAGHTKCERGSASLEFVTAGMILLVPLVYLVLTMAELQAGALAAEGAARQAARVFVVSGDTGEARSRAARAIELTLSDYGIDPASARVEIACTPQPAECLTRRGFVTVTIEFDVALPLAPSAVGGDSPLVVPLGASSTQQVSRFRGTL